MQAAVKKVADAQRKATQKQAQLAKKMVNGGDGGRRKGPLPAGSKNALKKGPQNGQSAAQKRASKNGGSNSNGRRTSGAQKKANLDPPAVAGAVATDLAASRSRRGRQLTRPARFRD